MVEAPFATDRLFHVMVLPDGIPPSLMVPMEYPVGTTSSIAIPVALSGPSLEMVIEKVTVSPILDWVGLTVFERLISDDSIVIVG